jgi:2-keto-3-deoxy-L-rhamnonate aldolase RhmA
MSAMIKVEEQNRGSITMRALDAGIQNLLFTDCRSAEDVKQCIRLVRSEAPESGGVHGGGLRRIMLGSNPVEWMKAMDDAVIAVMIEKKGAMEQLDEILSIKGVDMLQFGPLDYSVSVGKLDKIRTPEIQNVQKEMIKKAIAAGVRPRVEIGTTEQAKPFLDLGVRDFCVGHDLMIVLNWCREQGGEMRKLLESA